MLSSERIDNFTMSQGMHIYAQTCICTYWNVVNATKLTAAWWNKMAIVNLCELRQVVVEQLNPWERIQHKLGLSPV